MCKFIKNPMLDAVLIRSKGGAPFTMYVDVFIRIKSAGFLTNSVHVLRSKNIEVLLVEYQLLTGREPIEIEYPPDWLPES